VSTSPASRISTEAANRRLEGERVRFRRGLVGAIVVLALTGAGLGFASVLQGPRIQGAQVDLAAAVSAPSPLRIVLSQAIAAVDPSDVTVTPETPVSVHSDGNVLIVRFDRALEYDTEYRVALAGVSAAAGGVSVDLSHDFRTPAFTATWLQRSSSGDSILSGSPGSEVTTVYTAARIQDYLPLDSSALLVVTLDDSDASRATIVATDGSGNEEELVLPGGTPGHIEKLELAGTNVLYTFSSLTPNDAGEDTSLPTFDQTLFRLDLTGTHISEPVPGLDGDPLAVDTLIPVPGTTAALIHTRAGDVLRYDPAGDDPPALVGQYSEMIALAGDRHRLSVKDAFGPLIYDLDDGSETRIEPSPIVGTEAVPFIGDVVPVRDGRWIERAVLPNADFTSFDSFVAIDDGTAASLLFRTIEPVGSILDYRVTPNDRYLVAEVSPGGDRFEVSDGYPAGARPRDVTTVVIDIWAGSVVAEWPGSHSRW
jgi:hypothetical protein